MLQVCITSSLLSPAMPTNHIRTHPLLNSISTSCATREKHSILQNHLPSTNRHPPNSLPKLLHTTNPTSPRLRSPRLLHPPLHPLLRQIPLLRPSLPSLQQPRSPPRTLRRHRSRSSRMDNTNMGICRPFPTRPPILSRPVSVQQYNTEPRRLRSYFPLAPPLPPSWEYKHYPPACSLACCLLGLSG